MSDQKWTIYVPVFREPVEAQLNIFGKEIAIRTEQACNEAELISIIKEVDAVLVTQDTPMTRSIIEACPKLRVISKYGVGVDSIDIAAATEMDIPVTNTPGVNSDTVAEFTIGLIFALMRHIQKAKAHVQSGGWKDQTFFGGELMGGTVGVIGYGNIAKRFIRKLDGFDVKEILVFTESKRHEISDCPNLRYADLTALLKEADVITIHKNLSPTSRGMIGEPEFNIMRKSSILINTSRGAIIRESALIKALKEGKIAGAALDVCETEPIAPDNPLLYFDNVVLTPHIGSMTHTARERMVVTAAMNIVTVFRGRRPDPQNLVNGDVYQR
jgi:D-3-phosphoglycerate dehydrogenase